MNTYSNVATNDGCADDAVVAQHAGLVKRIAQHLIARLPSSVDIDDLMQSGMVGLLEAASNYDPTRGASFETYAGIRIRGSMLDDIRRHDWTPRSVYEKYRNVADAIKAIEAETGRRAETDEIAARLSITLAEYHKILADSARSRLFSLEETIDEPSLHRAPPTSTTPTPDQKTYLTQLRDKLAAAIDKLPERERLVLSLYYERELNLKEIGQVLEVTESRVCQIHGQAVLRLRTIMSSCGEISPTHL